MPSTGVWESKKPESLTVSALARRPLGVIGTLLIAIALVALSFLLLTTLLWLLSFLLLLLVAALLSLLLPSLRSAASLLPLLRLLLLLLASLAVGFFEAAQTGLAHHIHKLRLNLAGFG